ncbi:titin isoform X2 [Musca domestica]|uniref:Titin isoform X2 n=1 Tax=Musca domestica TaxID=7370 RepID=A0A9J7IC17_MUSDO|nr:titin isoform X2 [Musca domestica]
MERDQTPVRAKSQEKETHTTEVSLPGSNEISIDQPAILQVLSPINATEEKKEANNNNVNSKPSFERKQDANECPVNVSPKSSKDFVFETHNDENVNDDANSSVKSLVSSSSTENLAKTIIIKETAPTTAKVTKAEEKQETTSHNSNPTPHIPSKNEEKSETIESEISDKQSKLEQKEKEIEEVIVPTTSAHQKATPNGEKPEAKVTKAEETTSHNSNTTPHIPTQNEEKSETKKELPEKQSKLEQKEKETEELIVPTTSAPQKATPSNGEKPEDSLDSKTPANESEFDQEEKETEEIFISSVPPSPSEDNVLDIESHLIETLNEATVHKESVGIKELPPAEEELKVGCSKIETDVNVRSVIEVEPAEVVSKQPVEQILETKALLQAAQIEENETPYLNGDSGVHVNKADIEEVAQQLLQDIEEEVVKAFAENNFKINEPQQKVEDENSNEKTENTKVVEAAKKTETASTETKNSTSLNPFEEEEDEDQLDGAQLRSESQLSQVVDQQLSEVTSILDSQTKEAAAAAATATSSCLKPPSSEPHLKLVTVPTPQTASEEEERKLFIESLPPLQDPAATSDAEKLALDCKKEYYQSLKKYLIQTATDRPPVPLQTYRWEDLRRAKERGGYPWTHLYNRPLGPDEEPEIVLMLRKSQEIRFLSESPKSNKKVRIDDQVLIQETHPYLQELSEEEEEDEGHHSEHHLPRDGDHENHSLHSESFSCVSDSVLATAKAKAANRFSKVRRLFRRRRYGNRSNEDAQSLPDSFTSAASLQRSLEQVPASETTSQVEAATSPQEVHPIYEHPKGPRCFPIMKKLKSMADRQKKRLNIKRLHLGKDDKVAPAPGEEPKIINLKNSPKAQRSDIAHFEKQDSDDILEIEELDESPSRKRLGRQGEAEGEQGPSSSIVEPEEIIEIKDVVKPSSDAAEGEEVDAKKVEQAESESTTPPKKAPRLRREHVYEEIDQPDDTVMPAAEELKFILDATSVDALKQSLATQDSSAVKEVAASKNAIPLDRMGSSEEEVMGLPDRATPERKSNTLLAPISSIDSASSDEVGNKPQLQPVTEEEQEEEEAEAESEAAKESSHLKIESVKKEASPVPSEKKVVTFSHVEDEAEPHREDIELPAEQMEAAKEANKLKATVNDHEYEPIGMPSSDDKPSSEVKDQHPSESQMAGGEEPQKTAEDYQKEIEEQFFKPAAGKPTPQTELNVEADDEPLPDEAAAVDETGQPKSGAMKSFMASAQDRGRKMQIGLKTQAGKLRTKFKPTPKKSPSSSPKAKERRKFKAPEFSKMKMPDIKRPDMSKFKDFKRPEFTKFSKPDMSKFKLPEMSGIKLGRSKSFKETETTVHDEDMSLEPPTKKGVEATSPQKKLFDFNFGTYPRVLRKKKKPVEPESSFDTGTATEATSVIPSTTTQPSVESSSSPQGDRGPGPVRSRWADKFSDVSFNDSEGSRYRRYGSELESFDRESSLERRMREDLEDTVSEEPHEGADSMGLLGVAADNKEFAQFDEENRAIHEISNLRSREFKRRPIVHQDSDVRSEEDAVGWTEKEIEKNILLRKAELEAEASYHKYQTDDVGRHDTQSTASSGKKVVLEEISEDEFFLRKRGISQDNIEINQYIRNAFRQQGDDYDKPINGLQHVGQTREYVGDYDVPPPKPRRLHKVYQPQNDSQEFGSYGDNFSVSQNGSDYFSGSGNQPPRRPMRKSRSRSKYSMDSQDVRYMDEEYLREPSHENVSGVWNDLNVTGKENIPVRHEHHLQQEDNDGGDDISRPQPPRRQKRRRDTSMDKDSFMNGFGGRSVSNSYLQPTEDVIVYRTEHEYHHVPIATPDKYSDSLSANKSTSHYDLDEQGSRGAMSMGQDDEAIDVTDKYVIEMLENDGYAVVRKEQIPKPTPPARRKRYAHLPGDRYATMPNMRTKRSTPPPPDRPPPPRGYTPVSDVVMPTIRKSALSLDARPNYREDDYEEPGRPESPRNLQSGDIINKMKYRPLPPPPRPPREKRNRSTSKGSEATTKSPLDADEVDIVDGIEESEERHFEEVEASTQTDPLPDDFVCEEFEITDDMKIIEPRIIPKTIEEMLQEELEKELENVNHQVIDSEQLARGLQRFRESNQRSLSERSRASSQADRSKSQSRPQTPSAILVQSQSSTPVMKDNSEPMLEASLIVRPIDDLELEEEELRREGLLTDESQHSGLEEHKDDLRVPVSEASYAPSSTDIDEALGHLPSDQETQQTDEEVERTLQRYRDELDEIGRQLMETQTTSQEDIRESDREERSEKWEHSDREEPSEKWEHSDREEMLKEPWQLSDIEEMRSDLEEITSEREELKSDMEEITSEREEELKSDVEALSEREQEEELKSEKYEVEKSEKLPAEELAPEAAEEEEEEEIPFEKEFTPLATPSYRVETPTSPAPMPPPRRKSTTAIDSRYEAEEDEPLEETKEVAIMQTVAKTEEPVASATASGLPAHISELEVERLRVHALQAGQIMVSQLHGQQISSEEVECKSGNIVVKNIELPPGLIEDIVERVRQTERSQHLTVETQTSQQNSDNEPSPQREVVPPPKPPRLRDLEAKAKQSEAPIVAAAAVAVQNTDEQTQTEGETAPPSVAPVPPINVFPTAEYLQQLAPLAFYNLHRAQADMAEQTERTRHRRSVSPAHGGGEEAHKSADSSDETTTRRRRTRSTRTPSPDDPQSVTKAGRKFITACSLSLAKIINQLTDYVRGNEPKEGVEDATGVRNSQVPALAVLFIVITFCVLIFLMTGRSVHTHHWDYFNPPGHEGRPS